MLRPSTVLIVLLALSAAAPASAAEKIVIPSATPASLSALLRHDAPSVTVTGELLLPPQARGPLPAMVLKHGSGGMSGPGGDNVRRWAAALNAWGIAALMVDSFAPRGLSETATDQGTLSSWADVADALAALKALGLDPRIDRTRIGVVGWSRGGTVALETALETVRKSVVADDLKFAAHVVLYGAAVTQFRDRATDRSAMLFLHGEADDYVPIEPIREFAAWAQSMGNPVSVVGYPGTYHDFDVEGGFTGIARNVQVFAKCDLLTDVASGRVIRMNHEAVTATTPDSIRAYLRGCTGHGAHLGLNASARADAVERIHAFLRQYFRLDR
jgi:dienelactone hydrolase